MSLHKLVKDWQAGYTTLAPAALASKGRLMRWTVEGSIPNLAAVFLTLILDCKEHGDIQFRLR